MTSRKLLMAMVAAGPLLWASGASAAQIASGELSLNGSDTFTSSAVNFVNPANIGGATGSFAILSNCTGCASMSSFTSATSPPFPLYTAVEGNIVTTLTATTDTFTSVGGALPSLDVTGTGTLTLTGFDPTPGSYVLTTQGPGGMQVTFSVTSVPNPSGPSVPEPGSLMLLGTGLLGLGFMARRRRG